MKIKKVQVIDGVVWVSVPEAKLEILCGCPADVVKHLLKRGLITRIEQDGVVFETGPNAILLSDLAIQNGELANMGEFPVLQMLYKQGMLIPGHPGNTGQKGLIIGSKDQVNAQMQYIFRGNYGLITKEEIMQNGIEEPMAKEMMNIKLKFAFGKIRSSDELLDTCIVESDEAEIRNGLFIRRVDVNRFVFRYKEEKAEVNLSLPPNTRYETPYPLGFHNLKREYFAIIQSGQGDGWDPNRPSMCSVVMFQGRIYLIDAGPNLYYVLMTLGIGLNEVEGIFHTHSHDDHFAGLVTLIQMDRKIKYYSTAIVRDSVTKKLSALLNMHEDHFQEYFDVCDLELDAWNDIGGLEVKPVYGPHPVENNLFYFRAAWEEGYKTYAHLSDLTSFRVLDGFVGEKEQDLDKERAEFFKNVYLEPVDLKKIDIGGGLIHGEAVDYKNDKSEKIVLAHKAEKLTVEEKQIGSTPPFGIVDQLIPAFQDYTMRSAHDYIRQYFPNADEMQLNVLLNNPVETCVPGSMIAREGDVSQHIYLILTGVVEYLHAGMDVYGMLYAGSLVPDIITGMMQAPTDHTYKAVSYVRVLKISRKLFFRLVRKLGVYRTVENLEDKRLFLEHTWLFGGGVSLPVLYRVAAHMQTKVLADNEELQTDNAFFYMVKKGKVKMGCDAHEDIYLQNGDYCYSPFLINRDICKYITALGEVALYTIPRFVLSDIPIVRWRETELLEKRFCEKY